MLKQKFNYTDGKTYNCINPGTATINKDEDYCIKTYIQVKLEE